MLSRLHWAATAGRGEREGWWRLGSEEGLCVSVEEEEEEEDAGWRKALSCRDITPTSGSSQVPFSIKLWAHSHNLRTAVARRHTHTHTHHDNSAAANYVWIKQLQPHRSEPTERNSCVNLKKRGARWCFRGLAWGWSSVLLKKHTQHTFKNNPHLNTDFQSVYLCKKLGVKRPTIPLFCILELNSASSLSFPTRPL